MEINMKLVGTNGEVMYWGSPETSENKPKNRKDISDVVKTEECFDFLKDLFIDNPDTPMVFGIPHEGKVVLIPFPFENEDHKTIVFDLMAGMLKLWNPSWYVVGTEMYFSSVIGEKKNRKEGLILLRVEKTGKKESVLYELVKHRNKIKHVEMKDAKFCSGVLFELYNRELPDGFSECIDHFVDNLN